VTFTPTWTEHEMKSAQLDDCDLQWIMKAKDENKRPRGDMSHHLLDHLKYIGRNGIDWKFVMDFFIEDGSLMMVDSFVGS
jgi:hypothetical protein